MPFVGYLPMSIPIKKCIQGAWVRIYGVPLHAWNQEFFKLCVYDCGRFMRMDDLTMQKARFDFARILISTKSLEVLNTSAKVLVDGDSLEFKIIEEWGLALGEDACLGDEEVINEEEDIHTEGILEGTPASGDVEVLMNQLSEEWHKEGTVASGSKRSCSNNTDIKKTVAAAQQQDSLEKQIHQHVPAESNVMGSGSVHSGEIYALDSNCPHANESQAVNQAAGIASGSRSCGVLNRFETHC
jgi:hypothetical protein